METDRHLCVISILIRRHADGSLHCALDIAFLRIHLHQLGPRFVRVSRRIETSLIGLLRLFLMVQPNTQITQDLPLKPRFPIRDMLGLEMSNFGSKYGPYS